MDGLSLAVALVAIAYLSGSIPMGVLVARISGGPVLRTVGSGRTGGTNALRALGRKWAAVVVIGDVLKGALPVLLARVAGAGPAGGGLCGRGAGAGGAWSGFLGLHRRPRVGAGRGHMLGV